MCVCVCYIGGAVALRVTGSDNEHIVVVQGDKFDLHFECIDQNGAVASSGTYIHTFACIRTVHTM